MISDSENLIEQETQKGQTSESIPEPERTEELDSQDSSVTAEEPKANDSSNDRSYAQRFGWRRDDHGPRDMSFEEKLRSFKKQSEERLLHIKRSREAKIGKKKTR